MNTTTNYNIMSGPTSTKTTVDTTKPPFAYKTKEVLETKNQWELSVTMSEQLHKVLKCAFGGSSYGPKVNGKVLPITFSDIKNPTRLNGPYQQVFINDNNYMKRFDTDITAEMRELVFTTILSKLKELEDPYVFEKALHFGHIKMIPEQLPEEIKKVRVSWTLIPTLVVTKKQVTHLFVREDLYDFILHDCLKCEDDDGNFVSGKYRHIVNGVNIIDIYACNPLYKIEKRSSFNVLGSHPDLITQNGEKKTVPPLSLRPKHRGQIFDISNINKINRYNNQLEVNDCIDIINDAMTGVYQSMMSKVVTTDLFSDKDGWVTV